jgi:hypothetical protein
MNRLVITARLRRGVGERVNELLKAGPPFDPAEHGLESHGVYVSEGEVVFLFEGPEVEWIVDAMIDEPTIAPAFEAWRPLIEGQPHLARERYSWNAHQ